MTTRDIIKNIMDDKDISYTELGNTIGESKQRVWNWLNRGKKDIEQSQTLRLLDALGYKLMVVPGNAEKPPGAIEIKD